MNCETTLDLLSAYVDGECDARTARDIERHVAGCDACAAALDAAQALRARVRESLPYHAAPEALRARFAAPATPVPLARPRRAPRAWLAAAATVVVLAGGAWLVARQGAAGGEAALADEVVSAHVRSLQAGHLMDVASTDQHTVKPWFAGKLDYAPSVEDFAAEGWPLTGGRLDYVDHRAVAALVYTRRKHVVNVFEWPRAGGGATNANAPRTVRGFHAVHEANAAFEYWLVSDLNADELAGFARRLAHDTPPSPPAGP